MKKIFISQPMADKTDEEILNIREEALTRAKVKLGDAIVLIDSFIDNAPSNAQPLWYIAKSIELLMDADLVIFVSGWNKYRGCRIEHLCCIEYNIPTMYL